MIEQKKNQFINYIALGNAFDFERFNCYFDFMNRGFFGDENFLFGDFTVIGEIKYTLNEKFKIFAKAGYDINKNTPISTEHMAIPERFDMYVLPGSEYTFSGLKHYFRFFQKNLGRKSCADIRIFMPGEPWKPMKFQEKTEEST